MKNLFKRRSETLFSQPIRTLSARELDKIVGGEFEANQMEAGKGISAQDNQGKVMG